MPTDMEVISGFHPVEEALREGVPLHALYVDRDKRSSRLTAIRRLAKERGVKVLEVPREKLDELAIRHQGVVALVSKVSFLDIEELLRKVPEGEAPLLVMLDSVTDVGNVGAILRTVEVVGAHGVILQERNSPHFGEGMVKASAGALWRVPVARTKNLSRAIDYLKKSELWVVAAVPVGGVSVFEFDFTLPLVLIMGSEERGIRRLLLEKSDFRVSIPQRGKVQSLNVAVATGVMLYAAGRSRGWF